MSNIERKAKKLCKDFHLTKEYIELEKIKKAINNNQRLSEIKKEIEVLKKRLPLQGKGVQQQTLSKIQKLKEEYDNHPLVVNYNQLKSMLIEVMSPLTNLEL